MMEKERLDTTLLNELVSHQLAHLRYEEQENEVMVALIDFSGDDIVRGYGHDILDAINDLHFNLI